jgi:nucleotide-binding universal stress UspA family protein
MRQSCSGQAVVAGIDGSPAAVRAALWAVDEAIGRDMPVRLVFAIDPGVGTHRHDTEHDLDAADRAIRHVSGVVEATGKPVKIEVAVPRQQPARALIDESRSAAMVCVGADGLKDPDPTHIGSTVRALATSAHCPVAIIRRPQNASVKRGWIVAEMRDSPDTDAVLDRAVDEALLRDAPLRILPTWQARLRGDAGARAAADRDRLGQRLERDLSRWRTRHPYLDVEAVALRDSFLDYLSEHADSIRLIVIGPSDDGRAGLLLGPTGHAALRYTDCSVLVCDRLN